MLQTLYYLLFIPLVKIFHTSKCRLAPQECMSEFIVGKSNNADAAVKDDDRDRAATTETAATCAQVMLSIS